MIFLNQNGGRPPLATTQQPPDFSEIVCEEAVFHRISVMAQVPAFHRTYFIVFLMQLELRRAAPFISSQPHFAKINSVHFCCEENLWAALF